MPDLTAPPGVPTASLTDQLDTAVTAAPGIAKSPGAALDVAQSGGNVASAARSVDAAGNRQINAVAASDVNTHLPGAVASVLGGGLGAIDKAAHYLNEGTAGMLGDVVGGLTKAANVPLQAVQHEWRYLHDVEATHGKFAALAEGLAIAGLTAGGVALTGGFSLEMEGFAATLAADGGEAGVEGGAAEEAGGRSVMQVLRGGFKKFMNLSGGRAAVFNAAAGEAIGNVVFRKSWDRTQSGTYTDPHTGQQVSFGRDIASGFFHFHPGSTSYKALSGAMDASADIFGDPLQGALQQVGAARSVQGASGLLGDAGFTGHSTRLDNFEWKANPASGIAGQDTRRFLEWAGKASGAEIVREYPQLDPYVWDQTIAADPSDMDNMGGALAAIEDAQEKVRFYKRAISFGKEIEERTGGKLEDHLDELPPQTREVLEAMAERPYMKQDERGMLDHLEKTRVPHFEELRDAAKATYDAIPKSKLKGLAGAKNADEVADVFRRRILAPGESIGPRLPSRSLVKQAFSKVREAVGDSDNPVAQRIHKWTSLEPGLLNREAGEYTNGFDIVRYKRMGNLVRWLSPDLGQQAAYSIVNAMHDMDLPGRQQALENAVLMRLQAQAGLPLSTDLTAEDSVEKTLQEVADPKFQGQLRDMFRHMWAPSNPEATDIYGSTMSGEPPAPLLYPNSKARAAALTARHATAEVRLPSYFDMRHYGRILQNGRDWTGGVDSFLAHEVTSKIKPMMLASVGYPVHMGGAEMLPFGLKEGVVDTLKGYYHSTAGSLGFKAEEGDLNKAMQWVADRIPKGTRDSKFYEHTMLLYHMTEGHGVTSANSTAAFLVDADTDSITARRGWMHMVGKKYKMYSDMEPKLDRFGNEVRDAEGNPVTAEHDMRRYYWKSQIRQKGTDELYKAGAKALLQGKSRAETAAKVKEAMSGFTADEMAGMEHAKYKVQGSPQSKTPLDDWADQITEDLYAMTHKARLGTAVDMEPSIVPEVADHTRPLLHHIVNGTVPSDKFMESIPLEDAPLGIPGREILVVPNKLFEFAADSFFENVMAPLVNGIARRPMSAIKFHKIMDMYEPMVRDGRMTQEEQAIRAVSDMTIDGIRYMHNPADRTRMDQMLRNWVPFFFAQNQAYRRAGRLLFENPGAFRRYQIAITGVANAATEMQDPNGNPYIALPGTGFLSNSMIDGLSLFTPTLSVRPTGYGGTLSSLNVVFPMSQGLRPDESPLMVIPVKYLDMIFAANAKSFKDFAPVNQAVQDLSESAIGSQAMSESALENLIPNSTITRLAESAGLGTSMNNAMIMSLANMAYQQQEETAKWKAAGSKGPAPEIIPPLASANAASIQNFMAELRRQTVVTYIGNALLGFFSPIGSDVTVQDFGLSEDISNDITKYGVTAGYQHFLREHPDATAYTISHSSTVDSIPMKESQAAMAWVNQRLPDIIKNPSILYLMPAGTSSNYNPQAYLEQVADGLRTRTSSQDFATELYAQQFSTDYYQGYDQLTDSLAKVKGNKQAETQMYNQFDQFVQALAGVNPLGYQQFTSSGKAGQAQQVITGLQQAFKDGTAPAGEQSDRVKWFLGIYEEALDAYQHASTSQDYETEEDAVKAQWQTLCKQVSTEMPQLAPIISHVFRDAITESPYAQG
jgi:hypothetical protein